MSDADDQLGGTGGQYGRSPDKPKDADEQAEKERSDDDTDTGKESFPASDPPANY